MKGYLIDPVAKSFKVVDYNKDNISQLLSIDGKQYPWTGVYQPHFNLEFSYVDRLKIEKTTKDAWKFLNKELFVRFFVEDTSADSDGEWFNHISCGKMLIIKYDKDDNMTDVDVDFNTIAKLYKFSFPE